MGEIPFNLEAALSGERVVTRDGIEVNQLTLFDLKYTNRTLYGTVGYNLMAWNLDGKYNGVGDRVSKFDLFMEPRKK